MRQWALLAALAMGLFAGGRSMAAPTPAGGLSAYDVVWSRASSDETGSVPMGNGNVGVNLWVEEDGDLLFYVARNDAWAEQMTLCKLGRVRLRLSPNPFRKGYPYRQALRLGMGQCRIEAGPPGARVKLTVLVDSGSPTVYVQVQSQRPIQAEASAWNWRTSRLDHHEALSRYQAWISQGAPPKVPFWESADHRDPSDRTGIATWHRNQYSPVDEHMRQQGMERYAGVIRPLDPMVHNTFGMRVALAGDTGANLGRAANGLLRLAHPARQFELRVATDARQCPSSASFLTSLRRISSSAVPASIAAARTARWWGSFWNRSWIYVSGDRATIPANRHNLRIGADTSGGNGFDGEIARATVLRGAATDREIMAMSLLPRESRPVVGSRVVASTQGGGTHRLVAGDPAHALQLDALGSSRLTFPDGVTLEAWILSRSGTGRIFDKCTPGSAQGLVLDLHEGRLRVICGEALVAHSTLPVSTGTWHHVACAISPAGDRSRLYLDGRPCGGAGTTGEAAPPSLVTRTYVLAKYQLACQMRSRYPAHFQGGIFTMDPKLAWYANDPRPHPTTPDYRFYGTNYWWQNLRFLYQPQLAQGNHEFHRDLMLFMNRLAPAMQARAARYYGAKGLYFEECFTPFGIPSMFDFGWGATEYSEPYARWTWQHGLEASVMMLDDYAYSGDEKFLREVALPYATRALQFFDTRFKRDSAGRIRIFPTHALETYWTDVVNDTPSVAGLHYVTSRLLSLPMRLTTTVQRTYWLGLQGRLPAIPKTVVGGEVVPDNAESYPNQSIDRGRQGRSNYEAPDLYTVFPFRIYGLELPGQPIAEARAAWRIMPNPNHVCWYQTGLFAARLGLAEGAAEDVVQRAASRMVRMDRPGREPFRFPGFFGSPHDWCPDYDGAGVMMSVLQEMLVQNGEHGEIMVLPAWPRDWSARFRLHAARRTVVEGEVREGMLVKLAVTPASRRRDVRVMGGGPDARPGLAIDPVKR